MRSPSLPPSAPVTYFITSESNFAIAAASVVVAGRAGEQQQQPYLIRACLFSPNPTVSGGEKRLTYDYNYLRKIVGKGGKVRGVVEVGRAVCAENKAPSALYLWRAFLARLEEMSSVIRG